MLLIFLITAISAVLVFFLILECLASGETRWAWASFILFIVLIVTSLVILIVDGERVNLKHYNINQRQIEVVEERKENVEIELDRLVNKLPENTIELYKEIGSRKDAINFYPDIEFVKLIEEQMKAQQELQKKLTALHQEQALIQAEMENRRTFLPGKLMYKDNVVEKLKEIK